MISIIVPVYNAAEYLNKCVDSLRNQTFSDLEIILVDDGSTDESGKLCDDLAGVDSRISVVHKANGGLVSAWKAGVEASKGEYLSFVDSDDWVDTDMIEILFEASSKGRLNEIISSDYVIERRAKDGSLSQEYVYQLLKPGDYDRASIEKDIIPKLLGNENRFITVSRCMKLISSELIKNNMKYSDESIGMAEDMTVIIPAILDAERIVVLDHKAFYHYLLVNESMAHKYDRRMCSSIEKVVQALKSAIEDKKTDILLEGLDKEHIILLLFAVKNEARGNAKGYKENIIRIHSENEQLIRDTKVSVRERANKLLYRALCKPSAFNLWLLRTAMVIYYR